MKLFEKKTTTTTQTHIHTHKGKKEYNIYIYIYKKIQLMFSSHNKNTVKYLGVCKSNLTTKIIQKLLEHTNKKKPKLQKYI